MRQNLQDEIRAILDDAAARIHAAILAQLGLGASPRAPAAQPRAASRRTRTSPDELNSLVEQMARACKKAGDDGASRGEIMEALGITEAQFNAVKKRAEAAKLVKMKGTRKTARYLASG